MAGRTHPHTFGLPARPAQMVGHMVGYEDQLRKQVLLNIERLQVGIALYCCTAVLLCIAARIFPEQWQGRRGRH